MRVFISYNHKDSPWAQWLAWHLEERGIDVTVQAWDFTAGTNFILKMQDALVNCDRTVLVLSPDSLSSTFVGAEWAAVLRENLVNDSSNLIPVRVRECTPSGLLGPLVYVDFVQGNLAFAFECLMAAINGLRLKPSAAPLLPIREATIGIVDAELQSLMDPSVAEGVWTLSGGVPTRVELFQQMGVDSTVSNVLEQRAEWSRREVSMLVGEGRASSVEVSMFKDGPCGMVLGASGRGTSQTLIAMCVGLAVRYPPSRVRVHLIDFKGGAVWHEVRRLPHVVTTVTAPYLDNQESDEVSALLGMFQGKLDKIGSAGCDSIDNFNSLHPDEAMPIDVVFVDEAHGSYALIGKLERMQRMSRVAGVAVIVGAHSIDGFSSSWLSLARYFIHFGSYRDPVWDAYVPELVKCAYSSHAWGWHPGRGFLIVPGYRIKAMQASFAGHREPADVYSTYAHENASLERMISTIQMVDRLA